MTNERYSHDLKEVFLLELEFLLTGIAASQGEETAVSFVSGVTSLVNVLPDEYKTSAYVQFAVRCILECTTDQKDLRSRLVDTLGKNIDIKTLVLTEHFDLTELFFLFCEVVGQNSSLAHLDLKHSRIGESCAESLSRDLTVNSSLTNLDISWNNVGDTGAAFLSQAITVNSSLNNLNLSWNRIGDAGVESLSQALAANSSLTNLDLTRNSIGDTGAEFFPKPLR